MKKINTPFHQGTFAKAAAASTPPPLLLHPNYIYPHLLVTCSGEMFCMSWEREALGSARGCRDMKMWACP